MTNLTNLTRNSANRGDNDVALAADPIADGGIANILIVEPDADCADALETLLSDLPGIATVQMAVTAGAAVDLLDEASYDVVGIGIPADNNGTPAPDVIFIGAHVPDAAAIELELLEALTTFRSRVPDASIVLLCVYPTRYRDMLGGLVDCCIRKDTSASELRALIDNLRATRALV